MPELRKIMIEGERVAGGDRGETGSTRNSMVNRRTMLGTRQTLRDGGIPVWQATQTRTGAAP